MYLQQSADEISYVCRVMSVFCKRIFKLIENPDLIFYENNIFEECSNNFKKKTSGIDHRLLTSWRVNLLSINIR